MDALLGNADVDCSAVSAGDYKVIYIYSTSLEGHKGHLKIGEATLHSPLSSAELLRASQEEDGLYTSEEIKQAARARIRHQSRTIQVATELQGAYLALTRTPAGGWRGFRDHDVHRVLARSGYAKQDLIGEGVSEWFKLDLATAREAIRATAAGLTHLGPLETAVSITLRQEQKEAVAFALRKFRGGTLEKPKQLLWNAIMRFGKTVCAYSLIKEAPDLHKVLIITHRPVVKAGWEKDFQTVLGGSDYVFSSKTSGATFEEFAASEKGVYFASIQDLRASEDDGITPEEEANEVEISASKADIIFKKNAEVFATVFDLIIVDEGHEAVETTLASRMFDRLRARYKLSLSGTPFNISKHFTADETYSWTYEDEQRAKALFAADHPYAASPYEALPELEIRTYNIEKALDSHAHFLKDGASFNFSEFFRVKSVAVKTEPGDPAEYGDYHPFEKPDNVQTFLNLLHEQKRSYDGSGNAKLEKGSLFPFALPRAHIDFADTFWILPTVAAARTLHIMLSRDPFFSSFGIVNATGSNDSGRPFDKVNEALRSFDKTITLSVGKLTTGVTVPEWTGVFMLSGMKSAMLYAQTAFRVKSSGTLRDGRAKEKGFVFDFDPDRTLTVVAELSAQQQKTEQSEKSELADALDSLGGLTLPTRLSIPVIIWDGAEFVKADSRAIMKAMRRFSASKALESGFYDSGLFDGPSLGAIDPSLFDRLKNFGKSKPVESTPRGDDTLTISKSSLGDRLKEMLEAGESIPKPERGASPEELEEYRQVREVLDAQSRRKQKALAIMRVISVRLPLLVLGMERRAGDQPLTPHNFSSFVDEASWAEFMPKDFARETDGVRLAWTELAHLFDESVFTAAIGQLEERVRAIQEMPVMERIPHLYLLFSTFRSPDKETILTPAKVVNIQYGSTLGGLRWMNAEGLLRVKHRETGEVSHVPLATAVGHEAYKAAPEWVDTPAGVEGAWSWNSTFLDINSKTALYPLYAAASLYYITNRERIEAGRMTLQLERAAWRDILEKNIFVNTRVPYSATIAQRVLYGYGDDLTVNVTTVDVLELRKAVKSFARQHYQELLRTLGGQKVGQAEAEERFGEEAEPLLYRWVFNPTAMRRTRDSFGRILITTEERAQRIMTAATSTTPAEDLEKLLVAAEAEGGGKFTAVVGNPPYQSDNNGQKTHIWHRFVEVANHVSDFGIFVHPAGWIKGGIRLDETKRQWAESRSLKTVLLHLDPIFSGVGIVETTITFFDRRTLVDVTNLFTFSKSEVTVSELDFTAVVFTQSKFQEDMEPIVQKIKPDLIECSMESLVQGKSFFGVEGGNTFKKRNADYSYLSTREGLCKILVDERTVNSLSRNLYYYIDGKDPRWGFRNKAVADKTWKVAFPATGDQQYRRNYLLEPGAIHTTKYISALFETEKEAINYSSYLATFFYRSLMAVLLVDQNALRKTHRNVPRLDFATGEILDKPGTFLDFTKPETLDDQLAKVYGLTDEERELMRKDLKPWKDKVDVEADR